MPSYFKFITYCTLFLMLTVRISNAVTCVPSTTASLPVMRSLGFIFVKNARFNDSSTYNDYNVAQFTSGTLAAMDELFRRGYPASAVNVKILGTPSGDRTDCGRFGTPRACIQEAFIDDMERPCTDLETFGSCFLSTANIRSTIAALPIQTILFIYTNVGISDFDNTTALDEILQMAIAKRVQINVIFGFPEPISGNVYATLPFLALSKLSERTLGYYIPVYDAIGNLFGMSNASRIIRQLIPDLTQSPIRVIGNASNCNNVLIGPFEFEIDTPLYIVIQTNDVGVGFLGVTNPNLMLSAGYHSRLPIDLPAPWRLFQPGLLHFYFLQTNGTNPCSWSVYAHGNRAAYLSFTQNSLMDSGSPWAIKHVPNTVVAHVQPTDSADVLQINNPSLGWNNLNGTKRSDCQFDFIFGEIPIEWCDANDYGVMQLQSSSQMFSEVLPFLCVDQVTSTSDNLATTASTSAFTHNATTIMTSTAVNSTTSSTDSTVAVTNTSDNLATTATTSAFTHNATTIMTSTAVNSTTSSTDSTVAVTSTSDNLATTASTSAFTHNATTIMTSTALNPTTSSSESTIAGTKNVQWYYYVTAGLFMVLFNLGVVVICIRVRTRKAFSSQKWLLDERAISYDDSTIIGSGHSSTVHRGTIKLRFAKTRDVAVKIQPSYLSTTLDGFQAELGILTTINQHPNVIKFYGIITSKDVYGLVFELAHKNLLEHMQKQSSLNFDNNFVVTICGEIISGMTYLASLRIIHRDLAARNVLLSSSMHAKISDFGLCCHADTESNEYHAITQYRLPIRWLAIESLTEGRFSEKSDIWSFGILLYELYSLGKLPYADRKHCEIRDLLCNGNRLEQPEMACDKTYALMNWCWQANPTLRPTFVFLNSVNLSDYDYSKLYMLNPLYTRL